MRRSLVFAAAGLGLTLALTGCGSDKAATPAPSSSAGAPSSAPQSSPSAAPSSSSASSPAPGGQGATDPAGWVNNFCGSLTGLADLQNIQPPAPDPNDPDGARKSTLDLLTKLQNAFTGSIDGLAKLPVAPDAVGDKAKKTLIDGFTPVRDQIKAATAKLATAPPGDSQSYQDAATALGGLAGQSDNIADPTAGLKASAPLEAARQTAPNCKKFGG